MATVFERRNTSPATELAAEEENIRVMKLFCDFAHSEVGLREEMPGPGEAGFNQEVARALSRRRLEDPAEMGLAYVQPLGHLGDLGEPSV